MYPVRSALIPSMRQRSSASEIEKHIFEQYYPVRSIKRRSENFSTGKCGNRNCCDQEGVFWAYRGNVVRLDTKEPQDARNKDREALLIKHHVLKKDKQYERVRREVEALENIEKLQGATREPIPDSVRLFVWQRDKGQCVKCSSRERLEFDHIIPVVQGGSSTERNVQLLCEACNRSKGATI